MTGGLGGKTLLTISALSAAFLTATPSIAAGTPGPIHSRARVQTLSKFSVSNVQVSRDSFRAHSEPALGENPRNPNNLIAGSKFFSDPAHYRFKIGTYYSMNGGRTWHDSGLLPGYEGYHLTSDISIAFSRSGVAYAAVLACDGVVCPGTSGRTGIFVSRSVDGGKTFARPVPAFLDTTGATFSDKAWITVDQTRGSTAGTIYVAWNLDPLKDVGLRHWLDPETVTLADNTSIPAGMAVARSTDGGRTFSAPVIVAKFTREQFFIGAIPAVGPDGHVHVIFSSISNTQGVNEFDLVSSSDRGATFSTPRAIQRNLVSLPNHLQNSTFRNITLPTFAVSPLDGSMMVAWSDMRFGDADVLESRSLDGGKTWSKVVRVNDDRLRNGRDQFQPALAASPNGTFTCSWFDRRYGRRNRLIDEEVAQSINDGKSFGRNIRVTSKSWNPAIGAPRPEGKPSNTFIGDYQALTADNMTVHPLWNDTQNGRSQEIRTAALSVRLFSRR